MKDAIIKEIRKTDDKGKQNGNANNNDKDKKKRNRIGKERVDIKAEANGNQPGNQKGGQKGGNGKGGNAQNKENQGKAARTASRSLS